MRNHGPEESGAFAGERETRPVTVLRSSSEPVPPGLIFDFSELEEMRFQDLSVMLTARQMASEDDRTVWATGVPVQTWRTLYAMGLSGFFRPFPTSEVEDA